MLTPSSGIKRPAVWVSFSAFFSILSAAFLPPAAALILCGVLLVFSVVLLLTRFHKAFPQILLAAATAAAALGVCFLLHVFTVAPAQQYDGQAVPVQAEVLSEPDENYGKFYYTVRIHSVEDPPRKVNFTARLMHGSALHTEIGDTVSCTVKFHGFPDEFGLSSRTSQLAQKKVIACYVTDYESILITPAEKRSFRFYCAEIRSYLRRCIQNALPIKESSVLSAMLLGQRSAISKSLNDSYTAAGASHILVISGMHMSVLSQFAFLFLLKLKLRRRWAAFCTIVFILGFMCISGLTPSVVRSGVMHILLLLGTVLGRSSDPLNALAVALLVLMCSNPFCVYDLSLLFSFSSTLSIITFIPRISEWCETRFKGKFAGKSISSLIGALSTSVCAVIGSLPVQLYFFGTVNLTSIVVSLLVLPVSVWLLRFGMVAVLALSVPFLVPASAPFVFFTGLLIRYQNFVVEWAAENFPVKIEITGAYVREAVVVLFLFFFTVRLLTAQKKFPVTAILLTVILLFTGSIANNFYSLNKTKLLVLNNGYAECIAVIRNNEAAVLSCSGSGSFVADSLRSHRVENIRLLHVGTKESEIRCAADIAGSIPVQQYLLPDSVWLPTKTETLTREYGGTAVLWDDMPLHYTSNGALQSFEINGTSILLAEKSAAFRPVSADIAVLSAPDDTITAELTVLNNDKSLEEAAPSLQSGSCVLLEEYPLISIIFNNNGTYTIRNG